MNRRTPAQIAYSEANAAHREAHLEWRNAVNLGLPQDVCFALGEDARGLESKLDTLELAALADADFENMSEARAIMLLVDLACLAVKASREAEERGGDLFDRAHICHFGFVAMRRALARASTTANRVERAGSDD